MTFINFRDIYNKRDIMGRKKIKTEEKKFKFSITILPEINVQLNELMVNKSKLINWLLIEHFNNYGNKNM